MSDPLRERLAAMIAEWREAAVFEFENSQQQAGQRLDQCADDLEAVLRAVPAGEEAPRCVDHGIELICPICFGVTLVTRAAAPEGE